MNYDEIIHIYHSITSLQELKSDFPEREEAELYKLDTFRYRLQKAFKSNKIDEL